jgi:hypothetical protein
MGFDVKRIRESVLAGAFSLPKSRQQSLHYRIRFDGVNSHDLWKSAGILSEYR